VSCEALIVSNEDDGIALTTLLVDPGGDRMSGFDGRVKIDQVHLRLTPSSSADEVRRRAVILHASSGGGARRVTEPLDCSGFWLEQRGRAENECGLPRPGRSDHRHGFAGGDVEIDAAEDLGGRETRAEPDAEALTDRAELESERHADR